MPGKVACSRPWSIFALWQVALPRAPSCEVAPGPRDPHCCSPHYPQEDAPGPARCLTRSQREPSGRAAGRAQLGGVLGTGGCGVTKGTEGRWDGARAGAMSQDQPQVSTGTSMENGVQHYVPQGVIWSHRMPWGRGAP